jgi:hypothetical protein
MTSERQSWQLGVDRGGLTVNRVELEQIDHKSQSRQISTETANVEHNLKRIGKRPASHEEERPRVVHPKIQQKQQA